MSVAKSFKIPGVGMKVYNGADFREIVSVNWLAQIVYMSGDLTDFYFVDELKWNYSEKHLCFVI